MTLQINSVRAEEMARRLSTLSGESVEDAVTTALEERLSRLDVPPPCRKMSVEEIRARVAEIRAAMTPEQLAWDYDADLYDEETGLPK